MSNDLSRRRFLQTSAIAAGGLFASNAKAIALEPQTQSAPSKSVGANDRLRFGIIGVGMEGSATFIQRCRAAGSGVRRCSRSV